MNLDPAKLLVVFVIALMVLGPERLPKVARQFGTIWAEVIAARSRLMTELKQQIPDLPDLSKTRSVSSFLFDTPSTNPDSSSDKPLTQVSGEAKPELWMPYKATQEAASVQGPETAQDPSMN
jgi:Sec-independent protein translocase protein TatA